LLIEGGLTPFDPNGFGACMAKAPGYAMAYDAPVSVRSAAESVGFLKRQLLKP
jgi:hypothetical protein